MGKKKIVKTPTENRFQMETKIFRIVTFVFLFLFSLFSGIFLIGQLLGLFNLYFPLPVILFSILCVAVLFIICLKTSQAFFAKLHSEQEFGRELSWTSNLGYLTGVVLLIIVLILPLILWPYSGIRHELAWDAGMYHLPKAAELVVSHSLLDLSIAYAEYPSGYEILVAFSLLLNRAGNLIGTTHAAILVFFQLGLFLLLTRFSRLPRGILFFASAFVFASFDIIRFVDSNPFQMLRVSAFDIGMNDFFLASAIIALLVFSPLGSHSEEAHTYWREGMGCATLLILGTKPNGILIAVSMWAIALTYEVNAYIRKRTLLKQVIKQWLFPLALAIIGALWVIRNLTIIGSLFNPGTLMIQEFSIINNLGNSFFYNHLDLNFKIVLVLFMIVALLTIIDKKFHWSVLFAYASLLLSFCITPTSAFFGSTSKPAEIAWRFGLYLLAFLLPIVFGVFDRLATAILKKWEIGFALLVGIVMVTVTGFGAYVNSSRIMLNPANRIVLEDQFQESVGVDGYYSAYDYVRKTVKDSVIWVENGMPFYVFGKDLSNSISRAKNPDYLVFFQTAWNDSGGYPESISAQDFTSTWQLVYEDAEGRVYKRKND